jgi:hypothetical protein
MGTLKKTHNQVVWLTHSHKGFNIKWIWKGDVSDDTYIQVRLYTVDIINQCVYDVL